MTAVLDEIRQLEAAKSRGDMDEFAFRAAKAELIDTIDLVDEDIDEPQRRSKTEMAWQFFLFCLMGLICLTGIAALVLGDLTMALTVSVVVLTAITVRAFRSLED